MSELIPNCPTEILEIDYYPEGPWSHDVGEIFPLLGDTE